MRDKTENFDTIVKDIHDRLEAMGESMSEEKIRTMVREELNEVVADDEFVRKMRFGPNPDKELVGTKFARWGLSIADIEFLYDLQKAQEARGKSGPSEELERTFDAISDAAYLTQDEVREIDRKAIDDLFPRIPLAMFAPEDRHLASRGEFELTGAYQRAIRAMDTAESGYGSQLVGAQYVGELWEGAKKESRVFAQIPTFEMTDPTAYLPVEAAPPEMLYVSEQTAAPDGTFYSTSKTGSNRVQVDAKKFIIHQVWSGEMEEDSIIPYIPFLRNQSMRSLSHYSDSVVLNGDTTNAATQNINLDDADPADTKHYLAFDGIRHVGLVDNTNNQKDLSGGPITLEALRDVKGRMLDTTYLHDWGHPLMPDDLLYVADPETADAIAALDDVIYWWQIQGRPLLTGQVASALGHPVIGSIAMSKTESDGKVSNTGSNNVYGQVAAFNKRGFVVGWRRRVKVETERVVGRDQTRMVYSLRLGFGRFSPTGAASGIESADVIFDIGL